MTIKLCWENNNPVPARTQKTLRSSWDFAPDEERKRTIELYPIMHTGAMGLEMHEYLKQKRKIELARQKANRVLARIREQQIKNWEKNVMGHDTLNEEK